MAADIEGWIKVEGVWYRSPLPPGLAKKRGAAKVVRDAEGDPTDRCPDAGPWCGACRKAHAAKPEHPCRVCGQPTTILRSICISCGMKEQW
jgi:hypothetical protein